jgi:hypothetical protein
VVKHFVFFEVWTELLNIIYTIFGLQGLIQDWRLESQVCCNGNLKTMGLYLCCFNLYSKRVLNRGRVSKNLYAAGVFLHLNKTGNVYCLQHTEVTKVFLNHALPKVIPRKRT